MAERISDLVNRWDYEGVVTTRSELFNEVYERLRFLARQYEQYLPTLGTSYSDYESRLESWLENVVDEEDKQVLLEFAPRITFFSKEDFNKLHQAALNGPIIQWIIEELNLMLDDPDLSSKVQEEIHSHTWFCPISDSMPISDFHHANNIGGVDFRPDWRSMAKFGSIESIKRFMREHSSRGRPCPLKRLVLLEDFIGTGTQLADPDVIKAASLLGCPVLVVPLIICPSGAANIRRQAATVNGVKVRTVLELPPDQFINNHTNYPGGSIEGKVKDLIVKTYGLVEGNQASSPRPYSRFGLLETGAKLVMYSNTPANTLPIIQHKSDTWIPLFPRSARVK